MDSGKGSVLAGSGRVSATEKEPVPAGLVRAGEHAVIRTSMNTEMITSEEAESGETARLLVVLFDSGRVVLGRAQTTINNPRLEDKGFSSAVFQARLRKEFLTRTGHAVPCKPSGPPRCRRAPNRCWPNLPV